MSVLNRIDRKTALIAACCLVMAVPLAMFVYVVFTFKANAPWRDDFSAVLGYVNQFVSSSTLGGKLALIWAQRNHRIVIPHLVYLIPYAVGGKVDFNFYILFGDLGWLIAVGVLLYYLHRKYALPVWSLTPLPFLLLSLRLIDPMLWADSGTLVFWSLCFSILFFIALSEDKVVWACICFRCRSSPGAMAACYIRWGCCTTSPTGSGRTWRSLGLSGWLGWRST
jgi:hypothetical protein